MADAPQTVPAPARRGARRTPEAPALLAADGASWSYRRLDAAVHHAAGRLKAEGIVPGDRVACLLPRAPRAVVVLLALWRRGAVAAPLPAREPEDAYPRLLRTVDARALVAPTPQPQVAVPVLRAEDLAREEEEVAPPAQGTPPAVRWPVARPFTLVFTSGSTGAPKAALHTAGNHFFSAEGSRHNLPLAPGDRWLLALPLYHVGGLAVVLRALWAGATVALAGPDEPFAAALRRTEATHVSLVAAQLRRALAATPRAPAALQAALLGGGPAPPALVEEATRAGWPLAVSYGLTEMASQVTTTAPSDPLPVLQETAGRLLKHRRLHLRPLTGRAARSEPGQLGEILVGGRTRFAGYVEDRGEEGHLRTPFVTAAGEGGWFATGDVGRLDADGRLHVVGRLDRQFVSGGENVQPEEIEAALRRLPAVADAAVVPVTDDVFGRRPVAFVRAAGPVPFRPGMQSAALRTALRETLPGFKVPDAFYAWPEAADGPVKPDRALLAERARQLHGADA